MDTRERFTTHVVGNQPPSPWPRDLWRDDRPLREAVAREGGDWAVDEIAAYAKLAGNELMESGRLANAHRPVFHPFDPRGHRLDDVEFHPAYHQLMATAIEHGVPNFAWRHAGRPGAHVARAALMFLHNQADQGTSCPLTMTYACVPALQHEPGLAAGWLPRVCAARYDPRHAPGWDKPGVTIGMGMTEKQGGSDVRSNATRATPVAGAGPAPLYELVGHKWFFSAPMCDAFLVLAQAEGGLTCFLLPRFAPDGARNGIRIQRLKDKLGDWSNASAEVEFHGALAWRVGEEGRGVATILQMVALTRLDCLLGSASLMRQALVQALHFARHRQTFGKLLCEHALMRNVLADLALESEAATALAFRVARAVDASGRDPGEAAFARLTTALGKYWVCKRAPGFTAEAMECLGGVGYVEEGGMPRLFRQSPLNSIWEGSGNIQCLDVLRAMTREPGCVDAYFAELERARGGDPALDAEIDALRAFLQQPPDALEAAARRLAERMALALQASLLLRGAPAPVAAAFCAARLGGGQGLAYGTLPAGPAWDLLIERALPQGSA
ncbi:isovaleryl-CoA dehydrogenase [Arenimonas caeni]|jgi:putative acyl-CoA dehydrogenase|uniref:isovaleryl-CoA dehydrogenase n=1 Tax=Arenimonas caeni TaxID=2058085 RepID=UPI002A36DE66|nr:isovaleryl-CoA dehydrogenase [Arenimonas caeni]MDY0021023.1 isovaleryl-CoA dehydrogenase [Arenimonas caeni]